MCGRMEQYTRDGGRTTKPKGEGVCFTQMENVTRGNGRRITLKEKERTSMGRRENTRESGKRINSTELGEKFGRMALSERKS